MIPPPQGVGILAENFHDRINGMGVTIQVVPKLKDMKAWTDRLGRTSLRSFTDKDGHFWLEQNPKKRSKWARLAKAGHDVAWEFERPGGRYTGRMLIDGEIYTPSEATKKFLKT
jgi:hypothetical protein